jgi:hypothetical protein
MRYVAVVATIAACLALAGTARATAYQFRFSEEDLWSHTPSADSALYSQDAPRRHHTDWKTAVQTTDSAQPNQNEYSRQIGMGTNGWKQTATYDSWLNGGPEDNDGNAFGICHVQLWGANFPNSKFAWGERMKIANTGKDAWEILATPTGWSSEIVKNPWPDPGFSNDMYFIEWSADGFDERILYEKYGDGVEDYVFEFKVDIVGEYPTALESSPDGNPFESGSGELGSELRFWFGGYALDASNNWTNEGYDGVMELKVIPEPVTMAGLLLGVGCLGGYLRRRRAGGGA